MKDNGQLTTDHGPTDGLLPIDHEWLLSDPAWQPCGLYYSRILPTTDPGSSVVELQLMPPLIGEDGPWLVSLLQDARDHVTITSVDFFYRVQLRRLIAALTGCGDRDSGFGENQDNEMESRE